MLDLACMVPGLDRCRGNPGRVELVMFGDEVWMALIEDQTLAK